LRFTSDSQRFWHPPRVNKAAFRDAQHAARRLANVERGAWCCPFLAAASLRSRTGDFVDRPSLMML
jgi:hypothetical protein